MAQPDFKATLDDTISISATLDDAVGTNFDLTGCTITWRMRNAATGLVAVDNAAVTIEDGPTRRVRYTGTPALPNAGLYHGQFKVVFPDGSTIHFPRPTALLIEIADPV